MNLIVTDVCNRNCPYCFAESKLNRSQSKKKLLNKDRFISIKNYLVYLNFLKKSRDTQLKLLGGEPTQHPRFIEMVTMALEQDFDLVIFTNGLWGSEVLNFFRKGIHPKVRFVFNINEPAVRTKNETALQKKSLEIVGKQAKCGFNIFRKDFDLLFLGDIIEKYSLEKTIRLGLACPIANTGNEYIPNEDLKTTGTRLAAQLRQLEKRDIVGAFDCGFPLCMFSENELGSIILTTDGIKSLCNPIIDVGMDLMAWPCFPLSNILNVSILEYETVDELKSFYGKKLKYFRQFGSQEDCLDCKYRKRAQCSGGCLSRGLVEWVKNDPSVFEKLEAT
jgi:hypothetical protein